MRNLTIKRNKAFAGCAVKAKVYIEDATSTEITISGVPCRKLGDLKNGEEKTFEIGEEAAKVFVIFGKSSKDWCNDFYPLPEGTEDVYLTGQNKLNPANGNAFLFDNNDSPEVAEARQQGKKKGSALLIVAVAVGVVLGAVLGYYLVF